MAKGKKKAKRYTVSTTALKGLTGPCAKAMAQLAQEGRKVQVVGRVVNGKVELDQKSLRALGSKFPNAKMSFVAVNAPFDPGASAAKDALRSEAGA